jgi:cytochrome P450
MSGEVMARSWGKPTVFKNDRDAMFGNGLVMTEGDDWVRHRHVITPAFHPTNLKVSLSLFHASHAYLNMDGKINWSESTEKEKSTQTTLN